MTDPKTTAPAATTVPIADFLKVKGSLEQRIKTLEQTAKTAQDALSAAQRAQEEQNLATTLEGMTEADRLKTLRSQALKDKLEAQRKLDELKERENKVTSTELAAQKKAFAVKYGVDETVMAEAPTAEAAELAAAKAATEKKPGEAPPRVDNGTGGTPGGTSSLTPTQKISAHLQKVGPYNGGFTQLL